MYIYVCVFLCANKRLDSSLMEQTHQTPVHSGVFSAYSGALVHPNELARHGSSQLVG